MVPTVAGGGGGGGTILADLDWTTATGTSQSALEDSDNPDNGNANATGTGANIAEWGCPETFSVVAGGSVGLPGGFGNALTFQMNAGCSHVQFPHIFPLPVNGEDQFWACRAYYRNDTGQTDSEQHPHCFWPVGEIEAVHCSIAAQGGGNGNWTPNANFMGEMPDSPMPFGTFPKSGASVIYLTRDLWYRYEWIMHWRSATEFRVYPRLYDSDDTTLLADYTNYCHTDTTESLEDWYNADPDNWFTRRASSTNVNNFRTLSFGNGQSKTNGSYYRVAKARIALVTSASDFIGAP